MRATGADFIEIMRERIERFTHAIFGILFDVINHCR
jgi:hypothetical protein